MKGKYKLVIAILIVATGISYLVFAGVKETFVYYLTVKELVEKVPEVYNDKVRVSGKVLAGSIVNDIDHSLKFKMTDGENIVNVEYKGIVPDIFADDVEAVVEGTLTNQNVFKADLLLAKCPTKYESEDQLHRPNEYQYKKEKG
ncbi:MAG: cytochrome c maturation protein CcmE [Thermodesulfobacteriota bacterium]